MSRQQIPPPYPGATHAGLSYADAIRTDVATMQELALVAVDFLQQAYPAVSAATITDLIAAWLRWKTWDAEGHIQELKRMQAATVAGWQPRAEDEYLIGLCARRDVLAEQIQTAEAAVADLPIEGMGKIVEATMIMPLRQQHSDISEQITSLQKRMEQRAGDGQSPEKQ